MKNKWFYVKVLGIIIGGAIVFWCLAVCAFKFFSFGIIDAQGIVLSLVGILATFVVVSNYAQVLTIKQDFERKITEFEQNCKEQIDANNQEYHNKIQKIENRLNEKLIETEKRLKNKLILSNRIDALTAILENLKQGILTQKTESNEKAELQIQVSVLCRKRDELVKTLDKLKASETYQTIEQIQDWNIYFENQKAKLNDIWANMENDSPSIS